MTSNTPKDNRRSIADRWRALSPRTRTIIYGAAFVLLLAGVTLGVSALSKPSNDSQPVVEITEAEQSQLALRKGLEALGSGDTDEAISLLEEAVRLDPNNAAARDALERAREEQQADQNGGTGANSGSSSNGDSAGGNEPAPDAPEFLEPVDDLKALLPVVGGSFALGTPTATEEDATVPGTPANSDLLASSALWTVHDRETAQAAEDFIDDVSKSLYGQDSGTVEIDGAQAYFGTDGTRFATVTYVRGRYVFELVLSTVVATPAELQAEAIAASQEFPDSVR